MREEKVRIPNSIGGLISAVVHYPGQGSKGLAVLCPGYFDTKDYNHFVQLGNDVAEAGFTAICFDPTGTWESEGSIADYTMSQYLNDIRVVIDFALREKPYSDVCIMGHSIGGLLSIVYAARDSRVTKVVGIMPPYVYVRPHLEWERGNESEWAKSGFRVSRRDVPHSQEIREFNAPYAFVEDSRKYNALDEVPRLHVPLLLIAGEIDDLVTPEQTRMIHDKANEPKKYVVMKGMDHNYRHHPEQVAKINQEIIKFLA